MIDALSSRYGRLPSEIISTADTFDVFILNTVLEYENYQYQKEQAKQGKAPMPTNMSQAQMKSMIERARQRHGNKVS